MSVIKNLNLTDEQVNSIITEWIEGYLLHSDYSNLGIRIQRSRLPGSPHISEVARETLRNDCTHFPFNGKLHSVSVLNSEVRPSYDSKTLEEKLA